MDERASEPENDKAVRPVEAPQPNVDPPQPDWPEPAPALDMGLGLGSPDGFEQRAADSRMRQGANREQRVRTMTAMQRSLGNQAVQRFMVQRQLASGPMPVQRQGVPQAEPQGEKDETATITIDEVGVTNAVYNKPSFSTKDEVITPNPPPKDVKPEDDKVDVSAKAVCTFVASVAISLPSVPGNLTACQKKRVKDAIDNQLAPHEKQHEAAMKTYDGTYEEAFKLTQILRPTVNAALTAKAKEIADAQQAIREAAAKKASDALDSPPFVVNVDLNCEDEKKPSKKNAEGAGESPELAGGKAAPSAAEGGEPPT